MTDHFTTMLYTHLTDEALLVGARNILYKLSVDELRLKQTLTWHSLGELKKGFFTKSPCSRNFQNVKLRLFTANLILHEIQFWRIQTVKKCHFWQF